MEDSNQHDSDSASGRSNLNQEDLGRILPWGIPRPSAIIPANVNEVTNEWHQSKIVKFGGIFLLLFWTLVVFGLFGAVGGVLWLAIAIGIYISYKLYRKTGSKIAWFLFAVLIGVVLSVMFLLGHLRYY